MFCFFFDAAQKTFVGSASYSQFFREGYVPPYFVKTILLGPFSVFSSFSLETRTERQCESRAELLQITKKQQSLEHTTSRTQHTHTNFNVDQKYTITL